MKIVIFSVADKVYGADIAQVLEVIRMKKVTPVPDIAPFVEGVISLRGKVIPLVNLRKKLGLDAKAITSNRILVTKIQDHGVGILVDQVKDVVSLPNEGITKPDEILRSARYLTGVAKLGKDLILIVDLTELLAGDEKESLQKVHERVEVKKREAS